MFHVYLVCWLIALTRADYWSDRHSFIQDERKMALGSQIQLTPKEKVANEIIMGLKRKELEEGMKNVTMFPPAVNFIKAKKLIDKSALFSILKQMPKGTVLHTHDLSTVSADWIVKNVTYRDNLYACTKKESLTLTFSATKPNDNCWKPMKDFRKASPNIEEFDANIKSLFTLETDHPHSTYKDINDIWIKFMLILQQITSVLTFRPVYEDFIYETHKNFYEDKVIYFEMRTDLENLYGFNEAVVKPFEVVGIIDRVSKRFKEDYPGFYGMKIIYSARRTDSHEIMEEKLELYKKMKEAYPDLVAGFDISAQEDSGEPTVAFAPELLKYQDVKLFLHAGETNWNGMFSDKDLIDAILLNSTRIGHGYALLQHPKVLEEVKRRDIAIEVNPISNQVLMLVKDLRNHPGRFLIAKGYPVVISSDNFGYWGASGQNYDFYVTFMGLANADDDLRLLKQLAMNSIKYSALTGAEKVKLLKIWEKDWLSFIDSINMEYKNNNNNK